MNNESRYPWQKPVLHWLEKRAGYAGGMANLDWAVADPVVGHLAPALYLLDKEGKIRLSESARRQAALRYRSNQARWLVGERGLSDLLVVLEQNGVEVIPLKGAILQAQIYRNSGLRGMSDVDLLVRAAHFRRAAEVAIQAGFSLHPENGFDNLLALDHIPADAWPTEIILSGSQKNQGLVVEFHRHFLSSAWFLPAYPIDMDSVWQRSVSLGSQPGLNMWKKALSTYDMLAHLCLHQAMHGLQMMHVYLDIDLYVRNLPGNWSWDEFIRIIKQWELQSVVYHALSYCKVMLATPLPDGLLIKINPGWLARSRLNILISVEDLLAHRPRQGCRYPTLVKLALIDRLPRLFWTLLKLAFPDKAWHEQHPHQRNLFSHWAHVLDVLKLGG